MVPPGSDPMHGMRSARPMASERISSERYCRTPFSTMFGRMMPDALEKPKDEAPKTTRRPNGREGKICSLSSGLNGSIVKDARP
ncbi:hypothetical protein [Bradyrhizobium sp.]|uniref:hypothetical protein n=1 Tax=Bradyrhizobium sp. TaxID=376 RepID=UPI003C49D929